MSQVPPWRRRLRWAPVVEACCSFVCAPKLAAVARNRLRIVKCRRAPNGSNRSRADRPMKITTSAVAPTCAIVGAIVRCAGRISAELGTDHEHESAKHGSKMAHARNAKKAAPPVATVVRWSDHDGDLDEASSVVAVPASLSFCFLFPMNSFKCPPLDSPCVL